jgi:hypothetical protein
MNNVATAVAETRQLPTSNSQLPKK